MKVILLVCSDSVVIDQRRNSVSIFNLIDVLNIPIFPFVIQRMSVLTILAKSANEPSEPRGVQLVLTMSGQELFRDHMQLNFLHHPSLRHVYELQSIVVTAPGTLKVSIMLADQTEIGTWEILVTNIGPRATSAPQA